MSFRWLPNGCAIVMSCPNAGESCAPARVRTSNSAKLTRAIVAILSSCARGEATPERTIRERLGNQPDVSKALRLLVVTKRVSRSGRGGRSDPFLYTLIACQKRQTLASSHFSDEQF